MFRFQRTTLRNLTLLPALLPVSSFIVAGKACWLAEGIEMPDQYSEQRRHSNANEEMWNYKQLQDKGFI